MSDLVIAIIFFAWIIFIYVHWIRPIGKIIQNLIERIEKLEAKNSRSIEDEVEEDL